LDQLSRSAQLSGFNKPKLIALPRPQLHLGKGREGKGWKGEEREGIGGFW